jgi:uncharacterized protein YndB with AHSA1/START domain
MPDQRAYTETSKIIKAPRETLYRALLDPEALTVWLPPGEMTGVVHQFDARAGGGYEMSLLYPASDEAARGKTSEREDRFNVRFEELSPPARIVQAVTFESSDQAFSGEMRVIWTFEIVDGGTRVTVLCKDLPPGIRPADNEAGSKLSLDQLARYVEEKQRR